MNTQTVAAIIPTFNALHLLQKNCASVLKALQPGDELCIVDDASTDGTSEWVNETLVPQGAALEIMVSCVTHKKNLRFAAAVNSGVASVKSSLVFLCNNDVEVTPQCITQLREHFSDSAVFAVSCLEHEQELSGEWSGKNKLWFAKGIFQHSKAENAEAGPTAWASGGSALFSKEKWQKIGGFDTAFYPAYWEDIDLSVRAQKMGWKVLFDPLAVVIHKHESTHSVVFGTNSIAAMSWKNALHFTWKHANFAQRLSYLLWYPYWWYKRTRT